MKTNIMKEYKKINKISIAYSRLFSETTMTTQSKKSHDDESEDSSNNNKFNAFAEELDSN